MKRMNGVKGCDTKLSASTDASRTEIHGEGMKKDMLSVREASVFIRVPPWKILCRTRGDEYGTIENRLVL